MSVYGILTSIFGTFPTYPLLLEVHGVEGLYGVKGHTTRLNMGDEKCHCSHTDASTPEYSSFNRPTALTHHPNEYPPVS